ncbi:MAG: hypothetical protein SVZ03_07265 [Spirochaetota bacterium]|nr:hypothetical protein [Spirochaetota bacterium]
MKKLQLALVVLLVIIYSIECKSIQKSDPLCPAGDVTSGAITDDQDDSKSSEEGESLDTTSENEEENEQDDEYQEYEDQGEYEESY